MVSDTSTLSPNDIPSPSHVRQAKPPGAPDRLSPSSRPRVAAQILGISVPTLWRWRRDIPDFPKPMRLSVRCLVFDTQQLIAWRDSRATDGTST